MAPDERRATILRAARETFGQRAYAAVSIADIAKTAGASPALIMFYFGNKQALYLEVIRVAVDTLREGLNAVPGPPSVERMATSVRFYAEYARAHRGGFLSILRGEQDATLPQVTGIIEALRAEVTTQILADLAATETPVTAAGPATMLAVRGYLGYIDTAITHWLSLPDEQRDTIDAELIAQMSVSAFIGGLRSVAPRQLSTATHHGRPRRA